jgi:hypothetical protein
MEHWINTQNELWSVKSLCNNAVESQVHIVFVRFHYRLGTQQQPGQGPPLGWSTVVSVSMSTAKAEPKVLQPGGALRALAVNQAGKVLKRSEKWTSSSLVFLPRHSWGRVGVVSDSNGVYCPHSNGWEHNVLHCWMIRNCASPGLWNDTDLVGITTRLAQAQCRLPLPLRRPG